MQADSRQWGATEGDWAGVRQGQLFEKERSLCAMWALDCRGETGRVGLPGLLYNKVPLMDQVAKTTEIYFPIFLGSSLVAYWLGFWAFTTVAWV